jgi:phosphatidylethanolamine-binding protein (PEBP) family uncharacterized protein
VPLRPPSRTIITGALAVAVALGGCGSSNSSGAGTTGTQSATTESSAIATAATSKLKETAPPHPKLHTANGEPLPTTINVSSPGVPKSLELPKTYTCIGANTPLPITWSHLPARTSEVAVFVITANILPQGLGLLKMDWGAVNINTSLREITLGKTPAGAVSGRNEEGKKGLSICPPKGATTNYAVLVYALAHKVVAKPGFSETTVRANISNLALAGGVLLTQYRRAKG